MASPSSPPVPVMRWVMLALLAGVIWFFITGILSGLPLMLSPKLAAADTALAGGDINKATAQFDTEVRSNPTDPTIYVKISQICGSHKRYDLAIRYLESSLFPCKDQPRPARALLYVELSTNYARTEKKPQRQAIFAAQRAAELDPTSPTALNASGYTLADNGINLDIALAELTRALELLKKEGDGLETRANISMTEDSYGWALYKLGKFDLAAAALYQAINDFPEEFSDPQARGEALKEVYFHLGAAYHKAKRPEEARKALEVALTYDKGYQEALDELNALNAESPIPAPKPDKPPAMKEKQPVSPPASASATPGSSAVPVAKSSAAGKQP